MVNINAPIRFRPHHFLCAFCYQGKGYSSPFIKNFSTLMAILNSPEGEDEKIVITRHTDDICQACPHRQGLACKSEAKVQQLDAYHLEALELNHLASLTWGEAKRRIASHLTLNKFSKICQSCEWQASGICESVLRASGIK